MSAESATAEIDDSFEVSRVFDAPRERVWRARCDPAEFARWWKPKGCTIRMIKHEIRTGGLFHYTMAFQEGQEMFARFFYREVAAPNRLVFVNSFSDAQGGITRSPFPQFGDTWPLEVANTMTFTQNGGQTTVTLRGAPVNATQEERKTFAAARDSMRQAFGGSFEQLAGYLAAN
jgi:uncharacterized protein YndB with AHSA1/START domain